MDLYPAVLAFLKDHGLHKTATMLEREADCQIPVEAHPNLLDLYAAHLKRSRTDFIVGTYYAFLLLLLIYTYVCMGVSMLFAVQKGGASIDRGTFKRAYNF